VDGAGNLRNGVGFYAQARYTIGQVDIAAATDSRPHPQLVRRDEQPRHQQGAAQLLGGLQYTPTDHLGGRAQLAAPRVVRGEKQAVEVISLGASFAY